MDFRLGHRSLALQEIEIATLISLADVLGEHCSVATRILRRGIFPGALAPRQLSVDDMEVDRALVDVDLDLVAGLHEIERTTDEAFRRDVQDARAVAGAAH